METIFTVVKNMKCLIIPNFITKYVIDVSVCV